MQPKLVVRGNNELFKKLAKFGQEAQTRIESLTQITAQEIALQATQNVPANFGKVGQSIVAQKEKPLLWKVNVQEVPIAAYLEFGTGAFVQVAPEWKDLAYAFYVNGKGYLPPRPYLYPAWKSGGVQYQKDLKDLLKYLTDKYNK